MITFTGRQEVLKPAQILERNARNIYPHISTSRIKTHLDLDKPRPEFYIRLARELKLIRHMIMESGDFYSALIFGLQEGKLGNCTEDAIFTQLLGRINGQDNIYAGGIFIKDNLGKLKKLDHAVAFITNKNVQNNNEYLFKNKEAIIIDPWLNITDFASSYFAKIKTIFRNHFKALPNNNLGMELAKSESKTPKEHKQYMKDYGAHINFSIVPFIDENTNENSIKELKELKKLFPKFTIKDYKKIKLPNKSTD